MEHARATEIRIATADDDLRLSTFMSDFLSNNGFPFVMVRSDPDLSGGGAAALKRVIFEDDEISRRFRDQWGAQCAAPARRTQGRA